MPDTAPAVDLSLANCERIADTLRGKRIVASLLRPTRGLAPLDAIEQLEDRAKLRTLKLFDEDNALTRLGRRVSGLI